MLERWYLLVVYSAIFVPYCYAELNKYFVYFGIYVHIKTPNYQLVFTIHILVIVGVHL